MGSGQCLLSPRVQFHQRTTGCIKPLPAHQMSLGPLGYVRLIRRGRTTDRLTERHEREECSEPVHPQKDPVDSDDPPSSLPELSIWRKQPGCKQDSCNDAHSENTLLVSPSVEGLSRKSVSPLRLPVPNFAYTYPQRENQGHLNTRKYHGSRYGERQHLPESPFTMEPISMAQPSADDSLTDGTSRSVPS